MLLEFRDAEPTDIDIAVPLMYQSGPDAFNYVFTVPGKGGPLDFLRYAYADGAGEFGWRNHAVGILDGKVVATGGGWSGKNGLAFMLAGARQILGFYGLFAGLGVIVRGLRTEAVIPPPASDRHYLGHLGVLPEMQSRGIGKALVDYLLDAGKKAGFKVAALDVAVTNGRGQVLYERLGFAVTKERFSSLKNAHGVVANHRHMEMAI
ncbi:MAG: GNAT family N-acetyltransferase [Burkholderiaceae bacterium]|nr:GNAT family N-acetyltransferase [Burkholderiaceae bacterium]